MLCGVACCVVLAELRCVLLCVCSVLSFLGCNNVGGRSIVTRALADGSPPRDLEGGGFVVIVSVYYSLSLRNWCGHRPRCRPRPLMLLFARSFQGLMC